MDERQQAILTLQQGLEQLSALLRDTAPLVGGYYGGLREQGVPKELAGMLTAEMQDRLLDLMLTPKG